MYAAKEFVLYPEDSGKSLKAFKQGSDGLKYACSQDRSSWLCGGEGGQLSDCSNPGARTSVCKKGEEVCFISTG